VTKEVGWVLCRLLGERDVAVLGKIAPSARRAIRDSLAQMRALLDFREAGNLADAILVQVERILKALDQTERDFKALEEASLFRKPGVASPYLDRENAAPPFLGREPNAALPIPSSKTNRGFASMDPQRQREIAGQGGRASHAKTELNELTAEEAREAGRKGAELRSANKRKEAKVAERQLARSEQNGASPMRQSTLVDIWFVTNRDPVPSTDPERRFSDARSTAIAPLSYGRASVLIPDTHVEGRIERPRWWKLEVAVDKGKHMFVKSLAVLSSSAWSVQLNSDARSALLFVHGYNVNFTEAILRTAQLAYDLKFHGNPICFSWASCAAKLSYLADEATAEWSVPHLHKLLESQLSELRLRNRTLDVIAHSMGNMILLSALQKVAVSL